MNKFMILIFTALIHVFSIAHSDNAEIKSELHSKGKARVVITLKMSPEKLKTDLKTLNSNVKSIQTSFLSELDPSSFKVVHQYKSVPGLALEIYDESTLKAILDTPEYYKVDLDQGGKGSLDESRPHIDVDYVQSIGLTGKGAKIAILDSGYDSDHPDLADHLVAEHCVCTNCCAGGANTATGTGSAEDDQGHGTHVAGIVTGKGTVAPKGVAPDAEIVAVKVLDSNNSFCCSSDIVAGLDWILNNHTDVDAINMSLGTSAEFNSDCDNATSWIINYKNVITSLRAQGISSIVASMNAGNSNGMAVPACLSNTIAVGATFDENDTVPNFSNSGTSLDILAPGVFITSTQMGGGSVSFNGTSMATPHVAAVVALMVELYPDLSLNQLESCLVSSSVQVTDSRNNITRPRLSPVDAIACIDTIFESSFD